MELVQQLRGTIRKMELALGAIGDAVVWTDAAGAIEWCNETFERAVGRPRITILGSPALDVMPLARDGGLIGRDEHPVFAALRDGSAEGSGFEWRGSVVDISATRCQVGASPVTVVLALRDITEHVALEREIQRKRLELEEQNARLRIADRMKSDFLANMSHELRTPLNGIVGFSELLHDGKAGDLSAKQRSHAARILESARHLATLIEQMLDLAHVESGGSALECVTVEPAALLGEAVGGFHEAADAKRLRIDVEIEPGLGEIVSDPGRLQLLVQSYVSNAVKFTPPGGRVLVRLAPEGADELRLEVADTGPGIAQADVGRLFLTFEQLDAGPAKQHQGAGVGLALARRIAETLGGRVGVETEPGRGSTFFAVLPRRVEAGGHVTTVRRAG